MCVEMDQKSEKKDEFPPRTPWARLPTPLEKLERLSEDWGAEIWIKRDDQTGFEWSGNKVRKLEYLFHEAVAQGATCVATCGGIQSNHCRATAALAAKAGLRCILLLRGEEPKEWGSNYLLNQLFGAEIFYLTSEQYYEGMKDLRLLLEQQLKSQGGKLYFIPEGGSSATGVFGYAQAFRELEEQRAQLNLAPFDSHVVAHGSGGTLAGLVLGKLLSKKEGAPEIVGVNVCYEEAKSFQLVKDVLWAAIQKQNLGLSFFREDIRILNGYLGRGYALTTPSELKFYGTVAQREGVLLDPVYTGKAMLAIREELKKGGGILGKRILFWHTGGGFGLFKVPSADWQEGLRS
jgi:D-cysteine desulfhydrase